MSTTASSTASAPASSTTAASPSSTSEAPPLGSAVNQPLWPFTSLAEAQEWERTFRSGGHEPWHLDAAETALGFAQGFLGFTGITRSTAVAVSGRDAHVGVGFPTTGGRASTAAVVHLVRFGPDADAPWEVVGTADTTLTLTAPAYGATAAADAPLRVGGRITGVDESVRVQIRQVSSPAPLGTAPGVPAGGQNSPWATTVSFTGASDAVLTVVASTGGHFTDVERFAVTAVRRG